MTHGQKDTVIYIGSIMLPDINAAAQRALSVSKSLRDLGYNVVIVGRSNDIDANNTVLATKTVCQGFEAYSIPHPKSMAQWAHHTVSAKEFIEVIEHYGCERIKCVVVMEYEAIPLLKLCRFCQRHNIPLIADNLEWFGASQRKFPMNIVKDADTWLRMHIVYPRFVKNMMCISRYLYDYYREYAPNCVYIPGTIDPAEKKWCNLRYTVNSPLTIGYAGSPGVHFEKERLDLLFRAVAELNAEGKSCRLLMAGIDDTFIQAHTQLAKDVTQSNGMIKCMGHLSHREALEMIAACDFSIIVRENKRITNAGFPTKLSESFGCGTPVLSTRTSNIADYISDRSMGILCDGYDVDSIKQLIESAMQYSQEELIHAHSYISHNNPLRYEHFTNALSLFLSTLQ